jgi:protein-arginine kinase activator protein McsA
LDLQSAVENQEFERAIELRDELKKRGDNSKQ